MLVVAQAHDGTADLVVDALLARGVEVARIDTADFPGRLSLAATPDRIDSPGWLCVRGLRIDLESVRSVYRRSPARFAFPDGMSSPERRFATLESVYGLGGVLSAQPWRWIDHPSTVADASYKPRQLRVATHAGISMLVMAPEIGTTKAQQRRETRNERDINVYIQSTASRCRRNLFNCFFGRGGQRKYIWQILARQPDLRKGRH